MKCIKSYTRLIVGLIILVFVIFTLNGVNLAIESLQNSNNTQEDIVQEELKEEIIMVDEDKKIEDLLDITNGANELWQVEVPVINLTAPIAQDTTQEVMKNYVGHFVNTSFWKGNIGLAAHNRRISNKLF